MLNSSRFVLYNLLIADPDPIQSQAQYHIRELLKCLAHANGEDGISCVNDDTNVEEDTDEGMDDDQEEEQDDAEEEEDWHCPLQICMRLKEFETSKDLQRHYATRILTHPPYRYVEYC